MTNLVIAAAILTVLFGAIWAINRHVPKRPGHIAFAFWVSAISPLILIGAWGAAWNTLERGTSAFLDWKYWVVMLIAGGPACILAAIIAYRANGGRTG